MTPHAALMFAVFASNERARAAREDLGRARSDEASEVELVDSSADVSRRASAARPLIRRLGFLLGATLVIGFVIASLGALLLAALGSTSELIAAELVGVGLAVVLAAVLGGLAGGLAFSARTQLEVRRLCSLIDHGHGLLLFPARGDLADQLRRSGAVQIGPLS